jgi:diguanylate cyclase (GGDEF)-like protein
MELDGLDAAVQAIWARRRPEALERVALLEEAVAALRSGALPSDLRDQARREAHKLAGSAGTFGFPRASEAARELELALESAGHADPTLLVAWVRTIREELADRGAGAPTVTGTVAPAAGLGLGLGLGLGPAESARAVVLVVGADASRTAELVAAAAARGLVAQAAEPAHAPAALAAHAPSLVLLDAGPGGSEADLAGFLEGRDPAPEAPVPVIVLAAGDTLAERVRLARAGARRVLPAQLPPDRIAEVLIGVVEQARAVRPRVVALDDDPAILLVLESVLARGGVATSATGDPEELWTRIRDDRPDLVILDVDMPGTDGIELCRVIRSDAELADLPVLFLTGRDDPEVLQRIFAAGADDIVPKPIVPGVLLTRVRNRLDRVRLATELAQRDQLTGLPNRLHATRALERMLALSRQAAEPASLAVVDVDRFKRINDSYGHDAGDRVLRGIADVLRLAFRSEDVVARWGGEEFVVGLYGVGAQTAARRVEQALLRLREEGIPDAGEAGRGVTFSAGVAEVVLPGAGLDDLYAAADEALYRAKAGGRDRVVAAGASEPEATEHVDVVVVDDDAALTELLLAALRSAGHSALAIADGVEARRLLTGAPPLLRARALVLDVDLPGLDGLALLRVLGREGVLRRSRALMLTARAGEADTLTALELGAADHVAKPFSVPVLMQRIERALDA